MKLAWLKRKTALNRIEGIGLILILSSFLIQIIETDIDNEAREYENYKIQNKLDILWRVTSKEYADNHPEDRAHFSVDFKHYVDNWKIYSEELEYSEKWKNDVGFNLFSNCRIWLFIFGSIIVIIPKFIKEKT